LLSPFEGSISFLAIKDQPEVSPLSGGMKFQSLSDLLQADIRFFRHPLPASPTVFLAVNLPYRQEYGLTVFRISNNEKLGANYFPMVQHPRLGRRETQNLTIVPFG
jgi:hypothetical protein